MVEEVKAWRASDGSVYETCEQAIKRDLFVGLQKLEIFNEATRKAVIERAEEIADILTPYVDLLHDQRSSLPAGEQG